MKLTDYVIKFLSERGVEHAFGLSGGAIVHVFDSAYLNQKMTPIFLHHEQSGSFAAQAYAKANRRLGACFVTTGPGATNAITGLTAAWLDSVPCFYISGQTRLAHTERGKGVRQVGTQHLEVIPIVKNLTNYAVMVEDPKTIRYHLEKAYTYATTGRPGPVWIDLPLDLQWADVDPENLIGFDPATEASRAPPSVQSKEVQTVIELLKKAKRPLVLAGYGVRHSHAEAEFETLIQKTNLPFVTTWGAVDVLPSDVLENLGRPGVAGQRGANLAIQNSDLLICIGSHLPIPVTSTIFDGFAREAKIVMIDCDATELKSSNIKVDYPIQTDVKAFLAEVLSKDLSALNQSSVQWKELCQSYRRLNAPPAPTEGQTLVNPYSFVSRLSDRLTEKDFVVIDGGGTNVYISYQTFQMRKNQRMILSTALCSMGSGLPEAIGVCFANQKRRTICMVGDGSLQLNIQEFESIRHHKLPIKIFVTNNQGYLSIRQTQGGFLDGRMIGSSFEGGLSLPDYTKVAAAYGLRTVRIKSQSELNAGLEEALRGEDPVLCEILADPDQELIPRSGFKKRPDGTFAALPLEEMAPFLDEDEMNRLMVVPRWSIT